MAVVPLYFARSHSGEKGSSLDDGNARKSSGAVRVRQRDELLEQSSRFERDEGFFGTSTRSRTSVRGRGYADENDWMIK